MGQVVDSFPRPYVKPKNKPRVRTLSIGETKRCQGTADLVRIQPEGLLQPFKIQIHSEGQIFLGALSLLQIQMNSYVQESQNSGAGRRQRLPIDLLLLFKKMNKVFAEA